jgi:hypothetical protein
VQTLQLLQLTASNISTIATDIAKVITAANDLNEATSEIEVVANAIANVDTVGTNIANVNTVATNIANINAVNSNSTNINAVNSNSANINTVATNNANITTVATNIANVNSVNSNSTNINSVAGNSTNINSVATNSANINSVAGSIANVNTVATNIGSVNDFSARYRVSATAPTTSLDLGDLYFDTTSNTMKVYSSGGFINAGSSVNGTADRYKYTATASQTTFTGADDNSNTLAYDAGFLDVYLNGIKLVNGSDFTASSGTSIVLTTGASASDILEVIAYGTFQLANFSIADANDVPPIGTAGQVLKVNSGATALEYGTIDLTNLNASNLTSGTLPDARFPATLPATSGANLTSLNASNLSSGTVSTARLGTGTALSSNFLRGDGTWNTPQAGFSGANVNAVGSSAITLTSASTQYQKVQISSLANSYVTLPDATTLSTEGTPVFVIENNSPIGVALDIKNNSGTSIYSIPDNSTAFVSLVDNATTAGTWNIVSTITQSLYDVSSTVNSTTVTAGYNGRCIHLTSTKLVYVSWSLVSGAITGYFRVGDISGNTITFGSQQTTTITPASGGNLIQRANIIRLSDTAFIISWASGTSNPSVRKRVSVNTVSGTTITFGAQSQLNFPETITDDNTVRASGYNGLVCRMSDTKFAVVYNTAITSNSLSYWNMYSGSLTCQIITVSGTTLTVGTKVDLGSSTFTNPTTLVCHDTDKLCCVYYQHNSSSSTAGKNKMNIISVSGTTPTWGTSVNVEATDLTDVTGNLYIIYGWDDEVSSDTSFQADYGIALSTTRVFGICGGLTGNILIDISGTTPTATYTSLINSNYGSLYKPLPINSSTVYLSGKYIYISTNSFKSSPTLTKTSSSPNETTYSNSFKTIRNNSASTSFTSYSLPRVNTIIYSAIGTFSL